MREGAWGASFHDVRNGWSADTHVLLLLHTLLAVVRVRDSGGAAHRAAPRKAAKVALVAEAHQRVRPHVAVANHALALALFTQPAHSKSWRLAAHNEVRVVPCHSWFSRSHTPHHTHTVPPPPRLGSGLGRNAQCAAFFSHARSPRPPLPSCDVGFLLALPTSSPLRPSWALRWCSR